MEKMETEVRGSMEEIATDSDGEKKLEEQQVDGEDGRCKLEDLTRMNEKERLAGYSEIIGRAVQGQENEDDKVDKTWRPTLVWYLV